mmetsp:Transcript_22318/g.63739  ORF Transcript_22318/g.63739 Transcript_22318/m.63739 type:complete len:106 (+) Transcript_22318:4335-4652(+)
MQSVSDLAYLHRFVCLPFPPIHHITAASLFAPHPAQPLCLPIHIGNKKAEREESQTSCCCDERRQTRVAYQIPYTTPLSCLPVCLSYSHEHHVGRCEMHRLCVCV